MLGRTLIHAIAYHLGLVSPQTQTTERERETLGRLASGRRAIVELGVFEGVSARILRRSMDPDGRLWLVDPFLPGRVGICWARSIARQEVGREKRGEAVFLEQMSFEAVQGWGTMLDMVFIDADHSFEAVLRDWKDWSPFLVPGGVVAFHDSRVFPGGWVRSADGPPRAVAEILKTETDFDLLEGVDSLTVLRRRPA